LTKSIRTMLDIDKEGFKNLRIQDDKDDKKNDNKQTANQKQDNNKQNNNRQNNQKRNNNQKNDNGNNSKPKEEVEFETIVSYTGVELDGPSRGLLLDTFPPKPGWTVKCDHVTMKLGAIDFANDPLFKGMSLDQTVECTVVAVGESDKAFAVQVEGAVTTNKIPHVTIAHSAIGKPKDSNDITSWTPVTEKVVLRGTVKASTITRKVYQKKKN